MGDCTGITNRVVTQEMIDNYPELLESGFELGDTIDIGDEPCDGFVSGPMKKAGTCGATCKVTSPKIDGNKPFGWEHGFVEENFPLELAKLEDSNGIDACYKTPITQFIKGVVMMEDFDNDADADAIDNFIAGEASKEDLEVVERVLTEKFEENKLKGVNTNPLQYALFQIKNQIKMAHSVAKK